MLLALCAAAIQAADLSGTYAGTVAVPSPNGERQRPTTIVIKHTSDTITVSLGRDLSEQHPASNVKLQGDQLKFDVVPPGATSPAMKFDLKVEADKLTGTNVLLLGNGETRNGKVDLKKQ